MALCPLCHASKVCLCSGFTLPPPPPSHRATVATAVPVYERRALMLRKVRRHVQNTILHLNSPPTCVLCCAVRCLQLRLCSVVIDVYTDDTQEERDIKRHTLMELVDFCEMAKYANQQHATL